jgi:hypothetical protein
VVAFKVKLGFGFIVDSLEEVGDGVRYLSGSGEEGSRVRVLRRVFLCEKSSVSV